MNKSKKRSLLVLFALCALAARAQFDVHFTHYEALRSYYNPAVVGASERTNVLATYSMQMAGYTHAPATMLVMADMMMPGKEKKHALGVGILSDQIGLYTNQRIFGSYSYRHTLWGGQFSFGVSGGVLEQKFDGSKLKLEESSDPAFPSSTAEGSGFDLTAGINFRTPSYYVGVSGMHLTMPVIELGEQNEIKIDPSLIFNAGCNIQLKNPLLSVQPSLQLMTDLQAWRADIGARGVYTYDAKRWYVGAAYSPLTSVTLMLGGEVNSLSFGYAYELFTSGVGALHGSHDVFVGYVTDLDLFKKGKNKHKSIRVL